MDLIVKAVHYGAGQHEGQVRKYTGEAYFTHCKAVAALVEKFVSDHAEFFPDDNGELVAAALLHDTVEDTTATIEDVERHFGETVARYVYFLTKEPDIAGNRALRKTIYRNKLTLAPDGVKMIKFFDMFHNHDSIREHDPDFYETFSKETQQMMIAINGNTLYGGLLHKENKDFWLALTS